jgi:hypothetical protein
MELEIIVLSEISWKPMGRGRAKGEDEGVKIKVHYMHV